MNPPAHTADADVLEWSGSELAAVEPNGPNACTLRFAAARVWRAAVPGFWPDWRLTMWGVTARTLPAPAFGHVTEGHWTPAGCRAAPRWPWASVPPGPGALVLHLAHGGRLHIQAASWSVHTSSMDRWREDWSC